MVDHSAKVTNTDRFDLYLRFLDALYPERAGGGRHIQLTNLESAEAYGSASARLPEGWDAKREGSAVVAYDTRKTA